MKSIWILYVVFFLISSCSTAQSNKNSISTYNKTFEFTLNKYYEKGFIVKDSLDFVFGKGREGILISCVVKNERILEFKDVNDEPIKRLLLILEKTNKGVQEIVSSKNIIPSLGFGERSDIGYTNLAIEEDILSFKVAKLPYKSNMEYEFTYYFQYSVEDDTWALHKCVIEKLKPDDTIVSYILTSEKFGKVSIKEFNIYEFNPFVYL